MEAGGRAILLLRLHRAGLRPRDAPGIQKLASKTLRVPLVVRVSSRWVEIVAFKPPSEASVQRLARLLRASGLESLVVEERGDPASPEALLRLYKDLLASNRFWEAHVAGERLWRLRGRLGQALAALAGAYAKAQEGLCWAAQRVLAKALGMLRGAAAGGACLSRELNRLCDQGWASPHECLDWERLESLVAGRSGGCR